MEPILAKGTIIRFALVVSLSFFWSGYSCAGMQEKLAKNPFAEKFAKAYQGIEVRKSPSTIPATAPLTRVAAKPTVDRSQTRPKLIDRPTSDGREFELNLDGPSLDNLTDPVKDGSEFVKKPTGARTSFSVDESNQFQPFRPTEGNVDFAVQIQPKNSSNSKAFQPGDSSKIDHVSFWWKPLVRTQLRESSTPLPIETQGVVYDTIRLSPKIRALSQTPMIREMQIVEAESEFDTTAFVQSQFQDRVDPVGDNLSVTNDGTNFLDDHIWSADAGVRRKLVTGATYDVSQRLGFRNSNLAFFNPQDQGTATLALNVTQPLLRGRGVYYNRSQILIAQKNSNVAWNSFQAELQNEIQQAVEAYWRLYFDRSVFLQKQKNVKRAEDILAKLQGRAGLDSLPSQIARAKSAVLSRKTELANANRDIRNSETEIRRIVSDADWRASQTVELLPIELPQIQGPNFELTQVITTALENRNEIKETIQRAKIAAIQKDISTNELLPELSFLIGTYVSTLQGDSQVGDAFVDQFFGAGVKPGYSVGMEFEVPVGNRAAKSRLKQREFQLNRIKAEVDETMQNIIAESQIALRRVTSSRQTLVAAMEAITAARMDLDQSRGRWESFGLVEGDLVEGQTPTTVLDQLLDAQDRLTSAEFVFAQAELELKNAETALQRTMGTLLMRQEMRQEIR